MKWNGERVVPTDIKSCIDTFQQHMVRYLWALPFCKDKSVIDAACGTGYGSALLANVSSQVLGMDIEEKALEYARTYNNFNLNFVRIDLDDIKDDWRNSTIKPEIIVSFETIEHLDDPKKFLEWCKTTAPVVIGSIPISCPTKFHKHVLSAPEIFKLVGSVFGKVTFWYQDEMNINRCFPDLNKDHGMILFKGER